MGAAAGDGGSDYAASQLGYAVTAEIAKASVETGRSVRDVVLERGLLDAATLDRILSPDSMTKPGIAGSPS